MLRFRYLKAWLGNLGVWLGCGLVNSTWSDQSIKPDILLTVFAKTAFLLKPTSATLKSVLKSFSTIVTRTVVGRLHRVYILTSVCYNSAHFRAFIAVLCGFYEHNVNNRHCFVGMVAELRA